MMIHDCQSCGGDCYCEGGIADCDGCDVCQQDDLDVVFYREHLPAKFAATN